MSERETYQRGLLWVGLVLVVAGGITWFIAKAQLDKQQNIYDLGKTLVGGDLLADSSGVDAANAWVWGGVIGLIIGAVLILAFVIVRAAVGSRD